VTDPNIPRARSGCPLHNNLAHDSVAQTSTNNKLCYANRGFDPANYSGPTGLGV